MENKTIMLRILAIMLGIAAAVAGFAAEATRVKNPDLTVVYHGMEPQLKCEYKNSPSTGLAQAAVVALVIARVIITSSLGGCCSCFQTIRSLPRFARICVVISWITAFVAVILFIVGAIIGSQRGVHSDGDGDGEYYCYVVRRGVYLGAAILTLLSVVLALVYDVSFAPATNVVVETSGLELGVDAQSITNGKNPRKPSRKH